MGNFEIYYKKDNGRIKSIRSKSYNSVFDRENGQFFRWGEDYDDDPDYCVIGPELIDIEIARGKCSGNCPFCYKGNGNSQEAEYMSFETYKEILDLLPDTVNQIALGITDIDLNPDFWTIIKYTREKGLIPNYTCNGKNISPTIATDSAKYCGAVAVSLYDKDECYNTVKMFSDAGVKQVNIHFMLAEETIKNAFDLIDDIKTDPRLSSLFGVIFLQYKPHGRGIGHFTPIRDLKRFNDLIRYAEEQEVGFGFDSCSTPIYLKSIQGSDHFEQKIQFVEPCESGLFSYYCNTDGEFFPCSFMEGEKGWETGLKIKTEERFETIWHHERIRDWRNRLINSSKNCNCEQATFCRSCPHYEQITTCRLIPLEVM